MALSAAECADHVALVGMDHAGRLRRLRERLASESLDAILVTNPTNIRYVSGFTGSAGTLFVGSDETILITDGRYGTQAPEQLERSGANIDVEILGREQRLRIAELCSAGRVGFEGDSLSHSDAESLVSDVGEAVAATRGIVEELRKVKDAGEIARMRHAAAITDEALAEVGALLGTGITERDFGIELDTSLRRRGATRPSFETIVAAGPNAALPHARPGDRLIGEGELVVVDVGSVIDGYCSDMTRTLWVGELGHEERAVLSIVSEAQAAGVAALAPGVQASSVDAACRSVISSAGWGEYFTHGTGHGVGLDVHEQPRVSAVSGDTLAIGHVVTVEPGVYLPGRCGARIEDMLVITESGSEALTQAPITPPEQR